MYECIMYEHMYDEVRAQVKFGEVIEIGRAHV